MFTDSSVGHTHIPHENNHVLWLRQSDVGPEAPPHLGNISYAQAAHSPENMTKVNPIVGHPSPIYSELTSQLRL